MIEETKKTTKASTVPLKDRPISEPEIQDVDLGYVEKRKFRINGDSDRILELNVSDLNIISRFKEAYPKLQELVTLAQKKVSEISTADDADDIEQLNRLADTLKQIDQDMREQIDYLFDSNVSEICAPSGNMYDPVNGTFRFEIIIDKVANLYTAGMTDEFAKLKKNTAKYTSKYAKKYHK